MRGAVWRPQPQVEGMRGAVWRPQPQVVARQLGLRPPDRSVLTCHFSVEAYQLGLRPPGRAEMTHFPQTNTPLAWPNTVNCTKVVCRNGWMPAAAVASFGGVISD